MRGYALFVRLARVRVGTEAVAVAVDEDAGTATELAVPAGTDPLLAWCRSGQPPQVIGARHDLADVEVLAPIERPGKIVAIGLNYADHTAETGLTAPAEPLTFAKYPTSIVGPGADIVVPTSITTQADWEAELAVVIGTTCGPDKRATLDDIAGYTAANDVSARDLQFRDQQWTRGKSLDTFCPLGPVLITADEVSDPHSLRIWCTVNGQMMQDATTKDLIFDIPALLDFVSATVTLEPGDLILTGTPPGVGAFRSPPIFLQDGDIVTVGIENIGELTNPVRHV